MHTGYPAFFISGTGTFRPDMAADYSVIKMLDTGIQYPVKCAEYKIEYSRISGFFLLAGNPAGQISGKIPVRCIPR